MFRSWAVLKYIELFAILLVIILRLQTNLLGIPDNLLCSIMILQCVVWVTKSVQQYALFREAKVPFSGL